ncbi:MAG: RNHCP domain-containing protein [Deltaproteobacteria bacterium]|nr:RNHCP domain-containing protein [Deltaproteobacteria bacterium]
MLSAVAKKFQRRVESFTCEHCGKHVQGNGYTNHCPACLWSKHVDINPGDRLEPCRGLLEPISAYIKAGEVIILHRCLVCKAERRNKSASGDNDEVIFNLMQNPHHR